MHYQTYSISAFKSSFIQSLIACSTNGGIDKLDVHVLHKTNYGKIYANVSQFGYTGHGNSSLAQLAGYKNSATNLAISRDVSIQAPLAEFSVLTFLVTGLLQHLILI